MIDQDTINELWPHGDNVTAGLRAAIVDAAPVVFQKYGLDSELTVAHFMAQASEECGAGTEMTENIHYSATRACQVWPNRFSDVNDVYIKVNSFPGDVQFSTKLINNVYGGRMGNRLGTSDGSIFIGRGLTQVTGRDGYSNLGAKVGLDLVNSPDLVNIATNALECGVADFVLCGCLAPAQADDARTVTLRLNGGYTGLTDRLAWLQKWKAALDVS